MHLYVMTRGILSATKQWENDLSAQYLPLEIKNADGKIEKNLAQLQVRPVNLYEIVFPEGSEKTVMGMIRPGVMSDTYGKLGKMASWISKMLKLNKCITDYPKFITPPGLGVTVVALGTKKDKVNWEPQDKDILKKGKVPQEML